MHPGLQLNARTALVVALTATHVLVVTQPAAAFVWPALLFSTGVGVGDGGGSGRLSGKGKGDRGNQGSAGLSSSPRACRVRVCGQLGLGSVLFDWGEEGKDDSGAEKRSSRGAAKPNGAAAVSTPANTASANKGAAFTISTLLSGVGSPRPPSPGDKKKAASKDDGGEEGECEDVDGQVRDGEEIGKEYVEASADGEGTGDGKAQERGRRRDMYKIRSLLLQGQIAGLRERLKERELDVRELRVLTGGRGQSKLRELGAMLKEARGECDALRAREQSLAKELAVSQKEGDTLRGDLIANQKALADLNVYADSLRSRYTAEMVKLEASLAEMERELTRAEAAHMRERRELLDREAVAVADGQRFLNRTILLQGEVVKTRARETDLRRKNARLVETSMASTAEAESMAGNGEVLSLQRDNANLRSKIEALSREAASPREKGLGRDGGEGGSEDLGGGAATGVVSAVAAAGGGGGGGGAEEEEAEDGASSGVPPLLSSGSAESSPLSIGVDSESTGEAEAVVKPRRSFLPFSGSGGRRGRVVFEEAVLSSPPRLVDVVDVVATKDQSGQSGDSDQSADNDQPVDDGNGGGDSSRDRADGKSSKSEGGANSAVVGRAGFASEDEAKRAFDEAGVSRVVAMLRDENARLRKKLRAAENAVEAAEAEAEDEGLKSDRLEAELGRVRVTVKGRVQALKAALEEAERDAERAQSEREEFMQQWEEDVDALRTQLVGERRRRENERDDMEGVIVDLEDEVEDLKERIQQIKSGRTVSKKPKDTQKKRRKNSATSSGTGTSGRSDRKRPGRESKERSKECSSAPSNDEQWNKAMSLLQYLD